MDRNQDGEITPAEFYGDDAQFQKVDTNRDGYLSWLDTGETFEFAQISSLGLELSAQEPDESCFVYSVGLDKIGDRKCVGDYPAFTYDRVLSPEQ